MLHEMSMKLPGGKCTVVFYKTLCLGKANHPKGD